MTTSDNRVTATAHGVCCPIHGDIPAARYGQQEPAPCGCSWVWDEQDGSLRAVPYRGPLCDCGAPLIPGGPAKATVWLTDCPRCGATYKCFHGLCGIEQIRVA